MKLKCFGLHKPKIFSIVGDREVESFPQLFKVNLLTYSHNDSDLGFIVNHHNLEHVVLKDKNNFFNCPFDFHLFSCREYKDWNTNRLNSFKRKFITIEIAIDMNSFAFVRNKNK